jgi:hypothetical protein
LAVYRHDWNAEVGGLIFVPPTRETGRPLEEGYEWLASSAELAPQGLVPLAIVDEYSLACWVAPTCEARGLAPGDVVRWHRREVRSVYQLSRLDTDAWTYVKSIEQELASRRAGLDRMLDEIGPAYEESFLAVGKRPRDYVVRPVRIACQNVIVGLAAFAQESSFDGLSVIAWQTCEVSHVTAHEANRSLAALTLCDAFQNGGTMEIRFDGRARINVGGEHITYHGHPEGRVPASLRRYARSVGVEVGAEDPAAISPAEARQLFLAVTPMPARLRSRVAQAVSERGVLPERLCFTLLSQVWREIELDYILATSHRAPSILKGGADWRCRGARQAESEVCRAAVMLGMFYRRLNSQDSAASDSEGGEVRVVEDRTRGVEWAVDSVSSVVTLSSIAAGEPLPWTHGWRTEGSLSVVSCSHVTESVVAALEEKDEPVALLVPRDVRPNGVPDSVPVLRCPDRLADLDKAVEAKLLTSRISRG